MFKTMIAILGVVLVGTLTQPARASDIEPGAATDSAPPYQQGFPVYTGGNCSETSAQVADIDGDGDMEVLIGGGQSLRVFHHDGTVVAGFPVSVGGHATQTAAIADIDEDDEVEIVIAGQRSQLYVYKGDGTLKSGWPQSLGDDDGAACSPALADLDGDGDLEIAIGTFRDLNGNNGYIPARFYVFHHDGTIYEGWPVDSVDHFSVSSTPAIGDLDGDGDLEIVVGGRDSHNLWAFNADATIVPGWPVHVSGLVESSPTLADIDGDDDLEVFLATAAERVYAFHHDGTPVEGWPQSMGYGNQRSSPALGDIDGDGDIEIVCGSAGRKMHAWHHDGTQVEGWPQETGSFTQGTPALGDVDGDGDIEIVGGAYSGVYVWHHTGALFPGYPLPTGWSRSSPCLADLDLDGDVEILIGSLDDSLFVWDLPGAYDTSNVEWGAFRHNLWNTGFNSRTYVGVAEERVPEFEGSRGPGGGAGLVQNHPNPFARSTEVSYQLKVRSNVSLKVYDVGGNLVRTLVDRMQEPGQHSVIWDGRSSSGADMGAGTYFCRLAANGRADTGIPHLVKR